MKIENIVKELIEKEEVIFSTENYLYRVYKSSEEEILYDVFLKDSNENDLEDIEILDGGVYEVEEITIESITEALNFILEEDLDSNQFYLANYGTNENIEIFKSFEEAKKESIDNKVYLAELDADSVYEEDGIWNYEDNYNLIISTPTEIK